ncbi:ABC transporter ATP-binding protein [Candidatus Uhrbacteria bacterium]|nr:ABC transporter ATP-binding protein [Candidatus Uhrbacteria bacterium]
MISVLDLVKYFEDEANLTRAINGIGFDIKSGEFVAIMGPSGSGKSTLLNILSFLDRPTGGQYHFNGRAMNELSDSELALVRNKEMGFIFQSFNLLGRATVYQNVEVPLLYSDVAVKDRTALIEKAVEAVGLSDKLTVEAGKLSGGQKQRVAIARALINSPQVIFADEPTGNLDSLSGSQVMKVLKELHSTGKTLILVTHDPLIARFADRLIKIKDGTIESDQAVTKSGNK